MVHEVPDILEFFKEARTLLKPGGTILLVEPPFHVSKTGFEETLKTAKTAGLISTPGPRITLDETAVLTGA